MNICLKCGYQMASGAKFCMKCGYVKPDISNQVTISKIFMQETDPHDAYPIPDEEPESYHSKTEVKHKSLRKKGLIILTASLVLVLITLISITYILNYRSSLREEEAFNNIKISAKSMDYVKLHEVLNQYILDFPDSKYVNEAATMLKFADSEIEKAAEAKEKEQIALEKARIETEAKEKEQLALEIAKRQAEAEEIRKKLSEILLNHSKITIENGDTIQLTAVLKNVKDYTVKFSSNNIKVASVDNNGLVTANSIGEAKITATNTDNKTATCTITVTIAKPAMYVSENMTLNKGDIIKIDVIIKNMSSDSISYTSNNISIAKVDDEGNVTGVKPGVAKITVKSSIGLTATCIVTVIPKIKTIEFMWNYPSSLYTWTFSLDIPDDAYNIYKSINRQSVSGYAAYITEPSDDEYLASLANTFLSTSEKEDFNEWDTVNLVISFVQQLDYIEDKIGTGYDEYPKFPLETLYDEGGDCEDTSILLASLLHELDYGTVLIMFDDHMGVGIRGDVGLPGYYFTSYGVNYYYIETTNSGWEIGDLPEDYINEEARILHLID